MLAGAAGLLVVAAALAFLPGRLGHTEPTRVVVGGFENRTGDSALTPIGEIAADYIARGLATTQLLQDVYEPAPWRERPASRPGSASPPGASSRARVGAGTVLGGRLLP